MKFNSILCLFAKILCIDISIASVCNEISFVKRSEWKARKASEAYKVMATPVHHIFIHHTYEPDQCHTQATCSQAVRAIQTFHMDGRKWDDIGYNYLLGGDARIYEGRGWYAVGAHTLGMNDKAVALSLIGNFTSVDPPKTSLDLALKWIACAVEKGVVAKDYQLHGHRDQTCTECPGQHLYDIIKKWKNFKAGKLSSYVCRT